MWTYEDVEGIIENVTIRRKSKNNVYTLCQLLAHEKYVLHVKGDEGYTDEEGNYFPPSYSIQVIGAAGTEANMIEAYEAVLEETIKAVYNENI